MATNRPPKGTTQHHVGAILLVGGQRALPSEEAILENLIRITALRTLVLDPSSRQLINPPLPGLELSCLHTKVSKLDPTLLKSSIFGVFVPAKKEGAVINLGPSETRKRVHAGRV
jgi:hypothetical protein